MSGIIKNLPPNTTIVKVKQPSGWRYYPVYINVDSYMDKCREDGKEVYYLGKSNDEGKIEDNG